MRRTLDDIGFGPFTVPAADFYETDHDFVIELEVPGFEEKSLGARGLTSNAAAAERRRRIVLRITRSLISPATDAALTRSEPQSKHRT